MKLYIINQEPIDITPEEANTVIASLQKGVEYLVIRGEYIRSSAVTGVRNDKNSRIDYTKMWGMLPIGELENIYAEKREPSGRGYEKYLKKRGELLEGKS